MADLLVEIGTEEIPSDYLESGINAMCSIANRVFRENRLKVDGDVAGYGTPRRLVLIAKSIHDMQKDMVSTIVGPPYSVAFDKDGKPTKAGIGFSKKQGVSVEELEVIETERGKYVCVKKKTPGRPAIKVLSELIPGIIAEIPWSKSMRWGKLSFQFVRPIHWILAIFGGEVVPFKVADIKSGDITRGHRFMAPQAIRVSSVEDYLKKLNNAHVIIDPKRRREIIRESILKAADELSGEPILDDELLNTVTNMVEYPHPISGVFEERFLNLPEQVLITLMKEHQRYFAIRERNGNLMPNFIAINNTIPRDDSLVRKGHERVLKARLQDAEFFFKEDRKRPLIERLEELKGVIYHAELGTSYQKVMRFLKLAEYICLRISPESLEDVRLICKLSKCDLVTEMVMEFPSLQGVMGSVYARLDGYKDNICSGIYEHYMPLRAGDRLPSSDYGAIVGVADRLDTICAFFGIGLEPTGTSDPFALRRHSLAIIRILEHRKWNIPLSDMIEESLRIIGEEIDIEKGKLKARIIGFFRDRYKNMLSSLNYPVDLIDSVISAEFDLIHEVRPRIVQLKEFMNNKELFEGLVLTFKRVNNILKKQKERFKIKEGLFKDSAENTLWEIFNKVKERTSELARSQDYYSIFMELASLKKPVDELFDKVEIMTSDRDLMQNRIAMLQEISELFLRFSDLSKFPI